MPGWPKLEFVRRATVCHCVYVCVRVRSHACVLHMHASMHAHGGGAGKEGKKHHHSLPSVQILIFDFSELWPLLSLGVTLPFSFVADCHWLHTGNQFQESPFESQKKVI